MTQLRKPTDSVPANLPEAKDSGKSRDQAGKVLGVSGKSVDYATKILTKREPELVKAVEEGRMAVSSAAVLVSEPREVQVKASEGATRNYSKQKKKEKLQRHTVVGNHVFEGLRYADMAIAQLERIEEEDPRRVDALVRVNKWINKKPLEVQNGLHRKTL